MTAIKLHSPPDTLATDLADIDADGLGELDGVLAADDSPITDDAAPAAIADASITDTYSSGGDSSAVSSSSPATYSQSLAKLSQAKTRYLEASLTLSSLEQQRDNLKARIKSQKETVAELYAEVRALGGGPDGDDEGDNCNDGTVENSGGENEGDSLLSPQFTAATEQFLDSNAASSPSAASTDWAATPTSAIGLGRLKGFGAKKLEAIYDAAPTLGKLESLRADVYNGGLRQIKGIGESAADQIEECILNWLSTHRDSAVLNFAAEESTASGNSEAAVVTETADAEPPEVVNEIIMPDEPPPLAGDDDRGPILARMFALREKVLNGEFADMEPTDCFEDGQDARRRDESIYACNWTPGEKQDEWLIGWIYAQISIAGIGK